MYFKPSKSDKKKLRDKIGKLHLEILRLQRGDKCEICGLEGENIGRFHIIPLSESLRLEFEPENILLSHWLEKCQAHYKWHHYGADDRRTDFIKNKIIELRGTDYRHRLLTIEKFKDKHDLFYLRILYMNMKRELEKLKDNQ